MKLLRFLSVTIGFILLANRSPAAPPPEPAAIDAVVQASMKAWKVPGAALAIVRDGDWVYLQGYGVRGLEDKQAVTPETLFPIASCTKAFTATAVAMLVDEGKMAWDDPVRKHVEFFHLADPLADAHVTLRDLLCHRTGVGRHDWLWDRTPWDRETLLRKAVHVKPAHSFRSAYQYQNVMYAAAGFAVGRVDKTSWEDFVRKRLFQPLGMTNANCSTREMEKNADFARPHVKGHDGGIKAGKIHNIDPMAPAGGINASARDLVPWLRFQLGDGTFAGKRLVSRKNLDETHMPQTIIRLEGQEKALNPETLQKSYGLGWLIQDYHGRLMLSHTGGLDGYRARVVLVPRDRLGMVLLTNCSIGSSGASMHTAATNALVDLFLGLPRRDWDAYDTELVRAAEERASKRDKDHQAKRRKDTQPSRDLAAYAGVYEEPAYGRAEVVVEKGQLHLKWSSFQKDLVHFHFDTFTVKADEDLDGEEVLFRLNGDGDVASFRFLEVEFRKVRNEKR